MLSWVDAHEIMPISFEHLDDAETIENEASSIANYVPRFSNANDVDSLSSSRTKNAPDLFILLVLAFSTPLVLSHLII